MGNVPILDICTASEGVAYDHDIVPGVVEFTPCLVGYWDMVQYPATFESKCGDGVDDLVYEGGDG